MWCHETRPRVETADAAITKQAIGREVELGGDAGGQLAETLKNVEARASGSFAATRRGYLAPGRRRGVAPARRGQRGGLAQGATPCGGNHHVAGVPLASLEGVPLDGGMVSHDELAFMRGCSACNVTGGHARECCGEIAFCRCARKVKSEPVVTREARGGRKILAVPASRCVHQWLLG